MKKCCPRNTRSTPTRQNLRDKAFVAFVCLVGKPYYRRSWWEITVQKKSSQSAMNLAHSSAERHNSLYVDLSSVWNPSPPAFGRRGDLWRGRQSSPLAARGEAGRNAGISSEGRERRINGH
jgi:hypothetical protein